MKKSKPERLMFITALIITLAGNAFSVNNPDEVLAMHYVKEKPRLDVPYEPSPDEVVEEMIRLGTGGMNNRCLSRG